MIRIDLAWIAAAVEGRLVGANRTINQVSTDTRTLPKDCLFIALKGPNFDAHDFAAQALQDGAAALVVERELTDNVCAAAPQIIVNDTRYALGLLGAAVKAKVAPKTIAITGSSGKTTVKEMLAAILRQRGEVLATAGNFNNDIGVPLTLLRLEPQHEFAVIELGANHLGEIAYTTRLTQPDVAIINNVAPAHVEGFGDIHGVYRAKSEIFRGLGPHGLALTPFHSQFARGWQQMLAEIKHETFGRVIDAGDEQPIVRASNVQVNEDGCAEFDIELTGEQAQTGHIQLSLPGLHNVDNALVAIRAAVAVGCALADAQTALAQLTPVAGRLNVIRLNDQIQLIDDTYNANVGSVKAALDMLAVYPGYRMMVLGDMGELGSQAREYHEEVGAYAITAGIDNLYTLGVLSQSASEVFNGRGGRHFSSFESAVEAIIATVNQAAAPITILVKGSRSARMERVVQALQERQDELKPMTSEEGKHAC
ncbi:MAG: UDP-N-acetylmuramoyl-tripeptide--D-alanyl-D-alanine ligase [Idiomarina sp. 34-48-12]|nr:MAG: UDP-N-acetylmuramoyl-tripeptide--D-alanyl-D-alanine ligase [Idiomarina sp. 34-48-12]